MFPRGCSRRKPEPSYQQRSQSEGPCRQLSSWQWALSELLSTELADTDWKYESALAQCRHPRSLRGIHHSLENHKCSSLGRRLHRLPNFQQVFSMVRLSQPVPLWLSRPRKIRQREVSPQRRPMFPRSCSRRKPEPSYQQHSQSEGPCRQLSSWQWVPSGLLSTELVADTDWKYESALAQCRHPRSLRGIHYTLENHKCSSLGRRLHRLPNFQRCFQWSGCRSRFRCG